MVTFRFYIVSTVAFFLALAVGIVVGSALDERIVSSLQDRIDRVENNLDDTVSLIDEKNAEINDLEEFIEASAPYAVENQLPDASVVVVAEEGVEAGPVEDLVERLRQAGARADGILWLQPTWQLDSDEQRAQLEEVFSIDGQTTGDPRVAAYTKLFQAMLADSDDGSGPTTSTSTTTTTADGATTTSSPASTTTLVPSALDVFGLPEVTALEEAGFLRFQPIDGSTIEEGSRRMFVAATGTDSDFDEPGAVAADLATAAALVDMPAVVAEVFVSTENGPTQGTTLRAAREAATVSTVDDLELIAGRVATVLALAAIEDGSAAGHYGYGPETDGVLPEWSGP